MEVIGEMNNSSSNFSDQLELVRLLASKECQLLKTGYKTQLMTYYFCSCDPDQKEPMCLDCYNNCHTAHSKKEIVSYQISAICHCGMNCHRITKDSIQQDNNFLKKCLFMEWSEYSNTNIYYQHIQNSKTFCMFCANFCENLTNLNKLTYRGKDTAFDCSCTGEVHQEARSIFKKISEMKNLSDLEFEYFTQTQIVNLITMSEASFHNTFNCLIQYMIKLKADLEADPNYYIDSNIAYSAAMKALENLSILADSCNSFYYFNDTLDSILDMKFVFSLMNKKFDYKSGNNIWMLKNHTLNLYYKYIVKRDFESIPILSIKDIENLHPLQRLLYVRTVEHQGDLYQHYFGNLKINPLENTISIIERMNNIKDKNEIVYEIMGKCYEICLVYASLHQFSKEQILKFCSINDEVISSTEAEKKFIQPYLLRSQLQMMIPMVRAILYLIYYHNDEMLESFLRNQKSITKLNFFHSNSEVGKIINKNCINILNYVRNAKKSNDGENSANFVNRTIPNNIKYNGMQFKFTIELKNATSTSDNFKNPNDNLEKLFKEIERVTRKVLVHATTITSISINYPDYYLIGLRRLLDKNRELYLNYIFKDQLSLSQSEINFIDQVKILREELEEIFSVFFKFEVKEDILIERTISSIKKFFELTGVSNYQNPLLVIPSKIIGNNLNLENKEVNYVVSKVKNDGTQKILAKSKTVNIGLYGPQIGNNNETVFKNPIQPVEANDFKFKILVNKTFYIFSIVKSLKILLEIKANQNKLKEENDYNLFVIEDQLLNEIFRLMYFFIEDSPDNCMILFTDEILNTFINLNKTHIYRFIDLINYAFFIILKNNVQMISNSTVINIIKKLVIKISGDPQMINLLDKVIQIIRQMTEISYINQEFIFNKLREIIRILFEKNEIFVEFKNYLIEVPNFEDIELSERVKENFGFKRFKEHLIARINLQDVGAKPSNDNKGEVLKLNSKKDVINDNNIRENELNGYNITELFKVYIKFLRTVNFLFDGNATLNESTFLLKILSGNEIPFILKKKDLDLNLRLEILKFFRMSEIDVIIDPRKLEEYRSLFVNPILLHQEMGLFEDGYNYKFFNDLLLVNQNSLKLSLESAVLKFELKFFEQIIEGSKCNDSKQIFEYFENGIILPLFVFINKFMSIIYNLKGSEYLRLYEIVVYFLRMKKFLIENKHKLDKHFSFEFKNIFKKSLEIRKTRYSLLNGIFTNDEYRELIKDIEEMSKPHFEILNYKIVYRFFEKHLDGFITKEKSKSLKKIFEKREFNYSQEKIKKMENELRGMGLLKTLFEKKVLDAIVKYENDKNKFNESAFVQNLGEQNIQFDSNYRAIIIKTVFFLVNDSKLSEKYRTQNFWHLFKLLQYDTVPTQKEIYTLYQENKSHINFTSIVDLFLKNLLSLIFASCNPSTSVMNEDYYISIVIIKILKYMCEEHNIYFQTIFFKELKFDFYVNTDYNLRNVIADLNHNTHHSRSQVSLFDLLLGILGKIVVLSKWEKVKFGAEENAISYFYDIFFVIIELLIEMVQGSKSENFEGIAKNSREDESAPFYYFLQNMKQVLIRDKNDSAVVYKVRKDIIEFIVAFLEEKATPKKVINLISSVYNPFTIFETIVNTLKKLYYKQTCPNDINIVKEYKNDIFDHKKCEFFVSTYFSDLKFCETPEFNFSNRMYQYVKLLATQFQNEDAINIIDSINSYEEQQLINLYTQKLNKKVDLSDVNQTEIVLDDSYVQNYFAVKFFEKITRSVIVQKDEDEVMILFTLNPLVPYLSVNTKNDFYHYVNRESRYTKLFSLMEYCDYFFDEINYNASKLKSNMFLRLLNKINYYYAESMLFLITIIINLIMIINLDTEEVSAGYANIFPAVRILAILQVILNSFVLVAWFISKYPLYYLIETKKYGLKMKVQLDKITRFQKIMIGLYHTLLLKNETNVFIWNIIFSSIGCSQPELMFLFSIQLLIIINLSVTLKNIIKSVTLRYKQLLATSMFVVIMLYVFSCIGFFFLADDFIFPVGADLNHENQCGSLIYCFLTHLDWGLRTDGGIGEHLYKISYDADPGYYIGRFFYEILFLIIMIIILLSIVFGIIIDTFAELREEQHKIDNDKTNFCYICGAKRDDLEKDCINYDRHVTTDHDIWTYSDYMIGLKFVDPQETNAINSHVIEMIERKSISWFPARNKDEKH